MSLFATMMAKTGLTGVAAQTPSASAPAPTPTVIVPPTGASTEDAPAPTGLTEAQIEPMLVAAKADGNAEGMLAGATAERTRTSAVFASEAGQANMPMAAWMLENNPDASAETIVAKLGTMPKAGPAAAVEPPAPVANVTTPLAQTAKPNLNPTPNDGTSTSGQSSQASADDSWGDVTKNLAKSGQFGQGVQFKGELAKEVGSQPYRTGN